jgi:hypothetical protein
MAIYRVMIGFQLDSALPRDMMTINPHFFGDNPQALADAIKNNLKALGPIGPTMPFTIKVYDATKPAPNYYSTNNRPGYRGRLYIPVAMIPGGLALRPTSTQITSVLSWKTVFRDNLPAQHNWVVYSRKSGQGNGVSHVWVDDEWDTIRSRGLRSTTRTTQTLAA